MQFNGIWKNYSFVRQLLGLILLILTGAFIYSLNVNVILLIFTGKFVDEESMAVLMRNPSAVWLMQLFSTLVIFLLPALLFSKFVSDDWKKYLMIEEYIPLNIMGLILISMIVVIPLLNWLAFINKQVVFPEFLKGLEDSLVRMEESNNELVRTMFGDRTIVKLFSNLLLVGVIASIGEEFFFRGVLQNLFNKLTKNPHWIVWVVAVLFSAVHTQFFTFLPRLLLGAYLGYLLLWTKNIWIPVFAHLVNNVIGVLTYYFVTDPALSDQINKMGTGDNWWFAVLSGLLWIGCVVAIYRKSIEGEL